MIHLQIPMLSHMKRLKRWALLQIPCIRRFSTVRCHIPSLIQRVTATIALSPTTAISQPSTQVDSLIKLLLLHTIRIT